MENPPKPQPLRLCVQLTLIVENEEQARDVFDEIGTFAKGIQPAAIIGGNLFKMLGPCCPEKKP
jgi:hypothetical protein